MEEPDQEVITMKIKEQGNFSVNAAPARVLSLVSDPDFLGRTLPDSKGYRVTGSDVCVVEMKVGVSHMKGVMPTTLRVLPQAHGEPLCIRVGAQGLGSRVDMELRFDLHDGQGATDIAWVSDATISGVLASVGAGLLRPLAKRNFDAIVSAIQEAIEAAI